MSEQENNSRVIVAIPTYNEKEMVAEIIERVHACCPQADILIIDDSSPDGTADIVTSLQEQCACLHLLKRAAKTGLGSAYIDGFSWCLEQGYDIVIQMDADLSHPPEVLEKMIQRIQDGANLVIGSRYVKGGAVENWSWFRWMTSRFGSFYAATILGLQVNDVTGGFKAWHAATLKQVIKTPLILNDFGFQIEMNYRASRNGAIIEEEPILFSNRVKGQSKMSSSIVINALIGVWKIKLSS